MKYRTIYKEVEAVKFTGDNYRECKEFLNGNFDNTLNYPNYIMGGRAYPVYP